MKIKFSRPKAAFFIIALGALGLRGLTAFAQTIDFETMPDGSTPVPQTQISNQFAGKYGVSFEMNNSNGNPDGHYPKIAEVDDTNFVAFVGTATNGLQTTNHPATNQNVGRFFLTGYFGLYASPPRVMTINYSAPTAAASGVIIDIDGTEFWQVRFHLTNGQMETNLYYSTNWPAKVSPNAGDSRATPWFVSHTNADILSITFYGSNLDNANLGWAFDNFSPYSASQRPALSIASSSGAVQIGIAALFGTTNQLQYTTNLASANWLPLVNVIMTNSPIQFVNDFVPSNQNAKYYRAVQSQ